MIYRNKMIYDEENDLWWDTPYVLVSKDQVNRWKKNIDKSKSKSSWIYLNSTWGKRRKLYWENGALRFWDWDKGQMTYFYLKVAETE